jgi:GTPase SAR1 family protein
LAFVLLVFDVTNKESYDVLEDMVETFNFKNANPVKKLILVGNKAEDGVPRKVDPDEAKNFA